GTNLGTCTNDLNSCGTNLTTCTASLNARTAERDACTSSLDARTAELDACTADLGACNASLAAAPKFAASGQTGCWTSAGVSIPCAGTGQDGAVQAGAALSYTDNGDGTITDNNTKLVWEKKSADGSIHDVNTAYSWAGAFATHIAALNAESFGGHGDWRLPNVRELQSIADYGHFGPAVSSAFNSACVSGATVLTGSCTAAVQYWASTSSASNPTFGWAVIFSDGLVGEFF